MQVDPVGVSFHDDSTGKIPVNNNCNIVNCSIHSHFLEPVEGPPSDPPFRESQPQVPSPLVVSICYPIHFLCLWPIYHKFRRI